MSLNFFTGDWSTHTLSYILVTCFYSFQEAILVTVIPVKMVANASPMLIGCHFSVNVPSNAQEIFVKTVIVSNINAIPSICMRTQWSLYHCLVNMHVKCFRFSTRYMGVFPYVSVTYLLQHVKYINCYCVLTRWETQGQNV